MVRLPMFRRDAPSSRSTVTIVQPYVPTYRAPLFEALAARVEARGLRLQVIHDAPPADQAARGDAHTLPWSVPIRTRRFGFRGSELRFRPVMRSARKSYVVIAELASTNLDTYLLAIDPRVRLMLWGHGKSYVTESSGLDSRLELWLAKRAERVFVYTEGGASYLRSKGYEAARITVVRNTTDTVALREAASRISDDDVNSYRQEHGLGTGPVVCFVGGYDEAKLLPLLFEAASRVKDELPDFHLLVAGAGPLQGLVDAEALQHLWIHSLGRADTTALATIGRVASCMVIPGRVGLVAADALALGLPVVTTTFPFHAPEAEYLTPAVKKVAPQSAEGLAKELVSLLSDADALARAQAEAYAIGGTLTIANMADAFADHL